MRIHHLNCISSCPLGGRLMDGRARSVLERGKLCCHCLLAESSDGLVLPIRRRASAGSSSSC
jgi:hypothetical protein